MNWFEISPSAEHDLEGISDFTVMNWGGAQAEIYLDNAHALFKRLAEMPLIGLERIALGAGLRSFPFQSHIVYYKPTDFGVRIVRVLHKNQDPALHFES